MKLRLGTVAVVISLIASVMSITWIGYNWRKEYKALKANEKTPTDTV
ncbi:hypothetical protein [Emticicia sp. BO119]|nr:hypothetical protein [Emticicia sp. BO119]MBA4849485.1 hypothetical protein [Emticicia sp. BO119]